MSSKSSPGHGKRFTRFKQRISSVFSHSPSPAQDSAPHGPGRADVPPHHTENQLLAVPTSGQRRSISNVSGLSAANSMPTHPSPSPTPHLEDSAHQTYLSVNPAPLSPPQFPPGPAPPFQGPSYPHYPSQGMFSHAQNFTIQNPVFIDNNTPVDNFMEKLLQYTIIGAEFDSSARDPPPRCHPGTRLAIIQRCLDFILECNGQGKLRWVVGPAGVGKSAVMQMVVEKAPDGVIFASVFLSVNGRRDGTKTIITIAYQLAVKSQRYRQFILNEITLDPSLLQKSLSVHFKKFIVEPFIHRRLFNHSDRFLIVIDGLDECDSPLTQQNLLELISDFCITYPTSPIAWIIASRSEPHITSFFDKAEVKPMYSKEEIAIDSDEARDEVQLFLRSELKKIKDAHPTLKHKREWPSEHDFTMIAAAAGGLFAYASTVVRYIGDPRYRNPTAQLRHVLEVIHGGSRDHKSGSHPTAQLDALYARILANIPADVMVDVRMLLLLGLFTSISSLGLFTGVSSPGFRRLCNYMGLTEDAAYAATSYLHAVVRVPAPETADDENLSYFHKSFEDFLSDFQQSGFSHNIRDEANQLMVEALLNVVEQVPNNSDGGTSDQGIKCYHFGYLKGGPGSCDNISLSWPGDQRLRESDDKLQLALYRDSMLMICTHFPLNSNSLLNKSCFHVLTTRFTALGIAFPLDQLRTFAFVECRNELEQLGTLKQVPLRTLDYAAICGRIGIRVRSPVGMNVKLSDTWNSSCDHHKRNRQDFQWSGWTTSFYRFVPVSSDTADNVADTDIPRFNTVELKECHCGIPDHSPGAKCDYCSQRLARHFISNPDQHATIFVDSTEMCYVELSFVNPDDGVSEWTYQICHSGLPKLVDV